MIPQEFEDPLFSAQQIALIERQLARHQFPDLPNEIQVCIVAQQLQSVLATTRSPFDIALYLRRRIANLQSAKKQIEPRLIFRQFAEGEPKMEDGGRQKERGYVCRSKRKVRVTEAVERKSLEEFVAAQDASAGECNIIFERKSRKSAVQPQGGLNENCQWVYHEHFYCHYDRPYFRDEEPPLRKLLTDLKFSPDRTTYLDHQLIRLALPKPKLFTQEFIASEVEKLNEYRAQMRSSNGSRGRRSEAELGVGRQVVAVHPVCGHLHAGSILAIYKDNQFMVKFVRPELGTQKVLDLHMALKETASAHRVVVEQLDFEVMGLALKLLEYKQSLVKLLKDYNNLAEQVQNGNGSLDNNFYQQYGWIGSTINILTIGLRHVISKFRMRGVTPSNQEKISQNFREMLIYPLSLMEKELDKSAESADVQASGAIKSIISTYKESKTQSLSRQLYNKYHPTIKEMDWNPQQREEMQKLLKVLVTLLVNLKVQSRNFAIEDNKYVSELITQLDNRYPEHVNEIYQALHSITAKLNDDK